MAVPASLHTRLRIVPLDDEPIKKKVSFSDLNQIQKFEFNEPPILLHEHNETARLRAHIKLLEAQIDGYETPPTPSERSLATSVASFGPSRTAPNPIDMMLRMPQAPQVQRAVAVRPPPTPVQRPAPRPVVRQAQPKQISKTRKFFAKVALGVSILGALGIAPSIAACFIMLPLGVMGLVLSVGCAILGASIHGSLMDHNF